MFRPTFSSFSQCMVCFLLTRSRYYLFEEYLSQWYEKLKSDEATTMTVRLQQEIQKYKVTSLNNGAYSIIYNLLSVSLKNLHSIATVKLSSALCCFKPGRAASSEVGARRAPVSGPLDGPVPLVGDAEGYDFRKTDLWYDHRACRSYRHQRRSS